MLNQIKAVKELLTRSLGLDIPLRQPKQTFQKRQTQHQEIKASGIVMILIVFVFDQEWIFSFPQLNCLYL